MEQKEFINGVKDRELSSIYATKFKNKYTAYMEREKIERIEYMQENGIDEFEFMSQHMEDWDMKWFYIGNSIETYYSEMGWDFSKLSQSKKVNYSSEYGVSYKNYVIQDIWEHIQKETDAEYVCWSIINLIPFLNNSNNLGLLRDEFQKIMNEFYEYKPEQQITDEKVLSSYIKSNSGVKCVFGHIEINIKKDRIGQGGNGVVYSGILNNSRCAVKFLINSSKTKLDRFKAEYININIKRGHLKSVVDYYHFEILQVGDYIMPFIVMKKYESSLKKYRETLKDITWGDVEGLFKNLCIALKSMEDSEIIHRDLKPENILIDENNNYIISDFGIAHFDSEEYPIKNLTKKGERLANFEFCAPEQINGGKITFATDVYAIGQIIYWFVFGSINRGTGGEHLSNKFSEDKAEILDRIIYKCIANNPNDRYQNIIEITDDYERFQGKALNVYDDMHLFSMVVRSVLPEAYKTPYFTANSEYIEMLINKLNITRFNRELWYNTGLSNLEFKKIVKLENGNYLLANREIIIEEVWAYITDSSYNDVLVLRISNPDYYEIENKKYSAIAVINQELIVPIEKISSGYFRFPNGQVEMIDNLDIQERYNYRDIEDNKYIIIGVQDHCSIIMENDDYVIQLQSEEFLDKNKIISFYKNISKNKTDNVMMRM